MRRTEACLNTCCNARGWAHRATWLNKGTVFPFSSDSLYETRRTCSIASSLFSPTSLRSLQTIRQATIKALTLFSNVNSTMPHYLPSLITVAAFLLALVLVVDAKAATSPHGLGYIKRGDQSCKECKKGDCSLISQKSPIATLKSYPSANGVVLQFEPVGPIHVTLVKGTNLDSSDESRLKFQASLTVSESVTDGCYIFGLTPPGKHHEDEEYAVADFHNNQGHCDKIFLLQVSNPPAIRFWKVSDGSCPELH